MFKQIAAAAAAVILAGSAVLGAGANTDEARVRVLHASPDAPAVDIYANGDRVLDGVPFQGASGYLSVPAGTYTFDVRPAGADATSNAVLSATVDLAAGSDYTVAALNLLSEIEARVFVDNNARPADGQAHVQVIHASPDAPAVDIAVQGGPVLVQNLAFGEQQGPLPVPAATYDLEILLAGTDTVVLPVESVSLEAGTVYTVAAVGLAGSTPELSVVPLTYTPTTPPSAGSGGLLGTESDSGGTSAMTWAALAGVLALGGLLTARVALARARK